MEKPSDEALRPMAISLPTQSIGQLKLSRHVKEMLNVENESTDFLRGFVSAMLMIYNSGDLKEDLELMITEVTRQLACEIVRRKDND